MASCTVRSSSGRREPRVENQQQQSKKIGCMSGIFHLLHNHHHRHSRKRITSAGKKNRNGDSSKKPSAKTEMPPKPPPDQSPHTPSRDWRRLSCDVPRSPTLPAEIRRSNSVNSPTAFRRQPALVARLMGLEEFPAEEPEESTAEKRRKILGALEKCDQDLKALKKIIESVQATEEGRRAPPPPCRIRESPEKQEKGGRNSEDGDDSMTTAREKRGSDLNAEQPSPVSVLDGIPSPFKKARERSEQGGQFKKLNDHDHELNGSFLGKISIEQLPRLTSEPHKRAEGGPWKCMSSTMKMIKHHRGPIMFRGNKAMIEAVNEVWTDGIWRERWEFGRLGIVLEGYILGELVEEIVKEMGFQAKRSLPFENCRKRLCFS